MCDTVLNCAILSAILYTPVSNQSIMRLYQYKLRTRFLSVLSNFASFKMILVRVTIYISNLAQIFMGMDFSALWLSAIHSCTVHCIALKLLCAGLGAMKYCSCLLRGVMATLLNQWESSREKSAKDLPKLLETSCRVLEFMRKVRVK
jgi:Integrator complex subunit 5 C-terminus